MACEDTGLSVEPRQDSGRAGLRNRAQEYFMQLQDRICRDLELLDTRAKVREDRWDHATGGGGRTRIIRDGRVIESGGASFSATSSPLSDRLARSLNVLPQLVFGTGISLILHPRSPMVPTVHLNLRYIECEEGDSWFGGGTDLTPFYLFEEDARHFHRTLKTVCDQYDAAYYPRFKASCDEYFFLKHRGETRGIGGIFFDYLRGDYESIFRFVQGVGENFLSAYLPIVSRRRNEPWGDAEKEWQQIRRGRYVEFNLLCDRGTLFGIETQGRTESILLALPPGAAWVYDRQPAAGTREAELVSVLRSPRDWA